MEFDEADLLELSLPRCPDSQERVPAHRLIIMLEQIAELGVCEGFCWVACEHRLMESVGAVATWETHHQPFADERCVVLEHVVVGVFHYIGMEVTSDKSENGV